MAADRETGLPPSERPGEPPQILFRVAGGLFSLPLADVHEVALPGPLSRIPLMGQPLVGVMNLRGRILAVVDMGLLLGRGTISAGTGATRLLVLEQGRRDLALLVSEVVQITHLGTGEEPEDSQAPVPLEAFTGQELAARVAARVSGPGPRRGRDGAMMQRGPAV